MGLGTNKTRRDWRKPDLSIDVIIFAAPDVVNLNLYWSGNEAVLKGWSCPTGIPKLKKLKELKVVAAPVSVPTALSFSLPP